MHRRHLSCNPTERYYKALDCNVVAGWSRYSADMAVQCAAAACLACLAHRPAFCIATHRRAGLHRLAAALLRAMPAPAHPPGGSLGHPSLCACSCTSPRWVPLPRPPLCLPLHTPQVDPLATLPLCLPLQTPKVGPVWAHLVCRTHVKFAGD